LHITRLSGRAGRERVTDAESKQGGVHREVGEMWPLPNGDFVGKLVVWTKVAPDGVLEAPDRCFFGFWNDELATD
jgi:hypothetical protein